MKPATLNLGVAAALSRTRFPRSHRLVNIMNKISHAKKRVLQAFFKWRYGGAVEAILGTAPVGRGDAAFTLLSMVHPRDMLSYLVAVKSFARFSNPQRIVVVCDPATTDHERSIFKTHIPHVELRRADEFTDSKIPRGGCWERLFAISEYVTDNYVIQLDADTVTSGDIPEVSSAIREKSGFVLGDLPEQGLETLTDASRRADQWARESSNVHPIVLAESNLDKIGLRPDLAYVRGCAAFTGFPPADDMRRDLLDFSDRMFRKIGNRWAEWGTEQVTSNFLVANADRTRVLPYPKYCTPDVANADTVFQHFIGSMRFVNGKYQKASGEAMRSLHKAAVR
jgi:hypothetical protein